MPELSESPLLGLPMAVSADYAAAYPVEVDQPRTLALEQHVRVPFADAIDRAALWPAPPPGAQSYLTATGQAEDWDGAAWQPVGAWAVQHPATPGQAVAPSTYVGLTLDPADEVTGDGWTLIAGNWAAPPVPGLYEVTATVQYTATGAVVGDMSAAFQHSAVGAPYRTVAYHPGTGVWGGTTTGTGKQRIAAGESVRLIAYATGSAGISTGASSRLALTRIGP